MPPTPRLPLHRKWLYAGLATAFVLAGAFGLAEIGLRMIGSGHPTGFFREVDEGAGQVWVRESRWAMAPYFPEEIMRRPLPLRFPKEKSPSTYRLFVLGSSAAMGDPEPSFSVARATERLLQVAYPDLKFEVINVAVTAINSHVVRSIASDCSAYSPDGYFIYEGNNEVIGPYGPGTVWRSWLANPRWVRLDTFLRQSRVIQFLLRASRSQGELHSSPWAGLQSFLDHSLSATDPRLALVEAHFEDNLKAIVREGSRAGASVWLSTVLVNQRDFAPFRSEAPRDLTGTQESQWAALVAEGRSACAAHEWSAAEAALQKAWSLHSRHAETAFLLGLVHRETNRIQESDTWYSRAVDFDTLRFRTDSRLNDGVRRVASSTDASLIDAEKLARERPEGLGDSLLYEHVHLNMQGAYLLARALAEEVAEDLVRRGKAARTPTAAEWLSLAEVRRRLAYSPYEQVLILQELIDRFRRPPFLDRWGNAAQLAALEERERQVRALALAPETRAPLLELYTAALTHAPEDPVLWRNYGMAATALGDAKVGLEALQRALYFTPDDTDALAAALVATRRLNDGKTESLLRARLQLLEPRHPGLQVSEK